MVFDGNVYTDGIPVRKAAYAPGNPAIGPGVGGVLRNAFVYSRMRGRGGIAMAYPRNLRIPATANYWAPIVNNLGGSTVLTDERYVAAHWTHAVAQLCFTVLDDADTVNLTLDAGIAGSGSHAQTVTAPPIALSPGSEAKIDGALFLGSGGSYEAVIQLPLFAVAAIVGYSSLPGISLPNVLTFTITIEATATSKDASPVTVAKTLVMDSLSMWLECQEAVTP